MVGVVLVAALGSYIDTHKDQFPWLVTPQSWAQNVMAIVGPDMIRADHVTVIEIDDTTYDNQKLSEPTDRRFVASLVRAAVRASAAVVVLDLDLTRENADATVRKPQNDELLRAILEAQARTPPVPVVLAVLLHDDSGRFVEQPNAIPDSAIPYARFGNPGLPNRPLVGFVNAPSEPGQLPLIVTARPVGRSGDVPFWSLSLRAADAYDSVGHIEPAATLEPAVQAATAHGEFVYAGFLSPDHFRHVSADQVANGLREALDPLAYRIAIIGGHRHHKHGGWVDQHESPIGTMPGVYLHANRVEAILGRRLKRPSPWWLPWLVDLTLGTFLVVLSVRVRSLSKKLAYFAVFAVLPFCCAYFAAANARYALDFVLPTFLLSGHFVHDAVTERRHGGRKKRRAAKATPSAASASPADAPLESRRSAPPLF